LTIWERDLRGEPVEYLSLDEDVVVAVDRQLQRVNLFSRADGRLIERLFFRQPDVEARLTDLVHGGDVICGPDSDSQEEAIIAYDLRTGAKVWRLAVPKPVSGLFEAHRGQIGVGFLGGDVFLVHAQTGQVTSEWRVAGAESVSDGKLWDSRLILRVLVAQADERRLGLVALDAETGGELWRRTDLSAMAALLTPVRDVDGGIPAFVEMTKDGSGQDGARIGLASLDPKTGESINGVTEIVPARANVRLNGDFGIWPGGVILGTTVGVHGYRLVGDEPHEEGDY
jgi:hypothetical protein